MVVRLLLANWMGYWALVGGSWLDIGIWLVYCLGVAYVYTEIL
jgi:hypothetical protein